MKRGRPTGAAEERQLAGRDTHGLAARPARDIALRLSLRRFPALLGARPVGCTTRRDSSKIGPPPCSRRRSPGSRVPILGATLRQADGSPSRAAHSTVVARSDTPLRRPAYGAAARAREPTGSSASRLHAADRGPRSLAADGEGSGALPVRGGIRVFLIGYNEGCQGPLAAVPFPFSLCYCVSL